MNEIHNAIGMKFTELLKCTIQRSKCKNGELQYYCSSCCKIKDRKVVEE